MLKSDEFFVIEDVGEPVARLFKYSTDENFKHENFAKSSPRISWTSRTEISHTDAQHLGISP
ncbi:hypothetical protein VB002_08490 [Campylobacter concisus]